MKSIQLLENWEFSDQGPHAQPLHVGRDGRAILFTIKAGQAIREHNAPSSPLYVVVLSGRGLFAGGDGVEKTFGPNTLLEFDPSEHHSVRALENLVFVGFLHGAPDGPYKTNIGRPRLGQP